MATCSSSNIPKGEACIGPTSSDAERSRPSSSFGEADASSDFDDIIIYPMELTHPIQPAPARLRLCAIWARNKGVILVLLSMFFAASMDLAVRILETDHSNPMHAFQILFLRHVMTAACIVIYGYVSRRVEDHPLGMRQVRGLLVVRGISGFVAVSGIYFSLLYLPLAEATVLTFLAPIITCYANNITFRNEGFSLMQQLSCVVSFLGVALVALGSPEEETWRQTTGEYDMAGVMKVHTVETRPLLRHARVLGIIAALLGVLGQAGGMVAIRMIGPQAHPLISMNYSSLASIVFCGLGLLLWPGISLALPATALQWVLVFVVTGCGFLFQLLLTKGLAYGAPSESCGKEGYSPTPDLEKKETTGSPKTVGVNRAVGMMYTQLLFALVYDWSIFYHLPSLSGWAGIVLIVAGAIWVALGGS